MVYLVWLFLAAVAVIDNYVKSGVLFDVSQMFDTSALHHEHFVVMFILLAVSFWYVERRK